MEVLFVCLIVVGVPSFIFGTIWLCFEIFEDSTEWGYASIYIPFVMYVWVILNLEKGYKPALVSLAGLAFSILGFYNYSGM